MIELVNIITFSNRDWEQNDLTRKYLKDFIQDVIILHFT